MDAPVSVGVIGAGLINFETLRFLLLLQPQVESIRVFDVAPQRAEQFVERARPFCEARSLKVAQDATEALVGTNIATIATNSGEPHLRDLWGVAPESVILHISLRDFTAGAILEADNVVDDVEHVCSNGTSLDLAKQASGDSRFIRTTLGAILCNRAPARSGHGPVIFSPFGLAVLDLAVARTAVDLAAEQGAGTLISGFLPDHWLSRRY
jgi:ornithine cyclodeaminase/alanine dehydrogenase-like protein (mu-crystallin family)